MNKLLIFMMAAIILVTISGCSSGKQLPKAVEDKIVIVNYSEKVIKEVSIAAKGEEFGKSVVSAPIKVDENTAVSLLGGRDIDKNILFKVKVVFEDSTEIVIEKEEPIAQKNYLVVEKDKIEIK